MTLLVALGAWFAAGVLATLVLGPRLRRAAEAAGVPVEPEPVYLADRSPLRWRLGTLAVVGLLAGSTGMAAAGALPGSAQSLAHHMLGTVGVHVPEAADAPTDVATGPAATPWSDLGPSTSAPGPDGTAAPAGPSVSSSSPEGSSDASEPSSTASRGGTDAAEHPAAGRGGTSATTAPAPSSRPEGSDVSDDPPPSAGEPSDVPDEPTVGETPSTTTPPAEQPPGEAPPDDGSDPATTTTSTSTTSTSTTLPTPPPPVDPAG